MPSSHPDASAPRGRNGAWVIALAGLTLLGAALRWPALHGDLWMDEIWSVIIAHSEPTALGLFTHQTWANNHLLNTLWLRGVPESAAEAWFRLPSFLAGALSIPFAAWTLMRWGAGRSAALLAAALVSLGFFQIQFSTEARGYAGAFLCALIALGLRYSETRADWKHTVAFGIVQVAGLLWHPGYVLFVVALALAQGLSLVQTGRGERVRGFADFLRWQLGPGLALAAYQVVFLSRLKYGAAGHQKPITPLLEAAGWIVNVPWFPWAAALLLAAGFFLGIRVILPLNRELAFALVLACGVLPAAVVFLHPPRVTGDPSLLVLFPRYFHLPFSIALLAVAWGVDELRPGRSVARIAVPALLATGLVFLLPPFYRFGRVGSTRVLQQLASENSGTVRLGTNELTRGQLQFGFYTRRLGLTDRFVWIEPKFWLVNPPDFMISLAPGRVPDTIPAPVIRGEDRTVAYEIDRVYPYAGASGFNCVVSRRK